MGLEKAPSIPRFPWGCCKLQEMEVLPKPLSPFLIPHPQQLFVHIPNNVCPTNPPWTPGNAVIMAAVIAVDPSAITNNGSKSRPRSCVYASLSTMNRCTLALVRSWLTSDKLTGWNRCQASVVPDINTGNPCQVSLYVPSICNGH